LEARFRLAKFKVEVAERLFSVGSVEYPPGHGSLPLSLDLRRPWKILPANSGSTLLAWPRYRGQSSRGSRATAGSLDSLGGYRHEWLDAYSLDQRHIPYSYVRDEDVRAGKLRSKYDVLLYPHVDLELAEQIQGIPKAWGPMAFKKTRLTPSHGTPRSLTTSPAVSVGGSRGDPAVRRQRRTAHYARQWFDAPARGRHHSRRPS